MTKPKVKEKLYIVRKYIMAKSAKEALKKERRIIPDDVWVSDEWLKDNKDSLTSAIGYEVDTPYEAYSDWAKK